MLSGEVPGTGSLTWGADSGCPGGHRGAGCPVGARDAAVPPGRRTVAPGLTRRLLSTASMTAVAGRAQVSTVTVGGLGAGASSLAYIAVGRACEALGKVVLI